MNRFLHIIFLFCSYLVMTACDEADDSSNFGIDVSELVGKDYLSVLPATIQVGNFAGTFKLNIATNLTWSATTEDEWIKLPKTEMVM